MFASSQPLQSRLRGHLRKNSLPISALLFAILADTLSTFYGLIAQPLTYESKFVASFFIDLFGVLPGLTAYIPVKIAVLVVLAMSIEVLFEGLPRSLPYLDAFHRNYPPAVYWFGCVWYLLLAVNNYWLGMYSEHLLPFVV